MLKISYKLIIKLLSSLIMHILPETRCFAIKRQLYRWQGYEVGKNTRICSSVRILGSGKVEIGSNVWIGPESMISSSSLVKIGDNVDIAPRVFIGTGTHVIGDKPDRIAGTGISKDIIIKQGSWIGTAAIIMPGVVVNKMTIVNSGAVVSKEFEEYSLIAGVPARVIKNIKCGL